MGNIKDALPWYADGLRFECVPGCGRCCHTGEVGPTLVGSDGEHDAVRLAANLECSLPDFVEAFTVESPYRYPDEAGQIRCLKSNHSACIFLGADTTCMVYPARPRQCAAYPFFDSCLRSQAAWYATAEVCPGIGRGRVWTFDEIEAARATVHWEFAAFTLGM
jgi:Fe-S-cluster containining protein